MKAIKQTTITITDGDDKVVKELIIKRLKVISNARRLSMNIEIQSMDVDDQVKYALFTSAGLASTLCDSKGELLYPNKDGAIKLAEEMEPDEFDILAKAYIEINPIGSTLNAKKKKS